MLDLDERNITFSLSPDCITQEENRVTKIVYFATRMNYHIRHSLNYIDYHGIPTMIQILSTQT